MKLIKKDNILAWLQEMEKEKEVWVPATTASGDLAFSKLGEGDLCLELKPTLSCRRIFFPQSEDMIKIKKDFTIEEKLDEKQKIVFGIKSCDVSGLLYSDVFFYKKFEDSYYKAHRDTTTIITIACDKPLDTCFCLDLESGPYLDKGFDLQLYPISDDAYIIVKGSNKGEEILNKNASFFEEFDETQGLKEIAFYKENVRKKFARKMPIQKFMFLMASNKIPQEVYEKYSNECLSCGACAFVCPTCTCFDVREYKDSNEDVIRCRDWECCFFEGFTSEASGHNPRSIPASRIARRFEHKFKFEIANNDLIGCVGCGRCTLFCITKIGIHRFIDLAVESNKI